MPDQSPKQTKQQRREQQQPPAPSSPQKLEAPISNSTTKTKSKTKKKDHQVDSESGERRANESCSLCSVRCLVCLLMLLCLGALVSLLAIFISTPPAGDPNQCPAGGSPFRPQNYRLFSTKTLYSTANYYLVEKLSNSNQNNPLLSGAAPQVPDYFAPQTLESVHRELVDVQKCAPVQLHFYGRHAARYPNEQEIEKINKHLEQIQTRVEARIKAEKSVAPVTANPVATSGPASGASGSSPSNQTTDCLNPLTPYATWKSFLNDTKRADLLLDSGFEETLQLAQRLKRLYPEFFTTANGNNVDFGVTSKQRTLQTAAVFASLVEGKNETCQFVLNSNDSLNADCYSNLRANHHNPYVLEFHEACKQLSTPFGNVTRDGGGFTDPNRLDPIADSISRKLHLSERNVKITTEEVRHLYKICKYEAANSGSSIWCDLFSGEDLKFLEFIEDLDDYYNQAYGDRSRRESTCPLGEDLFKILDNLAQQKVPARKSRFFFSHSQVIERVFAALMKNLDRDPVFESSRARNSLDTESPPANRKFQTSLLAPFSANIMFSVYDCAASPPTSSNFADDNRFKVVTSLNERPLRLGGTCLNAVACPYRELRMNELLSQSSGCNLNAICERANIVYS